MDAAFWRALEAGTGESDVEAHGTTAIVEKHTAQEGDNETVTEQLPSLTWGETLATPESRAVLRELSTKVELLPGRVPTRLKWHSNSSLCAVNTAVTCIVATLPNVRVLVRLAQHVAQSKTGTQTAASLLVLLLSVASAGNPMSDMQSIGGRDGVDGPTLGSVVHLRSPHLLDAVLEFISEVTDFRTVYVRRYKSML